MPKVAPVPTAMPVAAPVQAVAGSMRSGPLRIPIIGQETVAGPDGTTVIRRSRWSHLQTS
jgi:hypothetical protein